MSRFLKIFTDKKIVRQTIIGASTAVGGIVGSLLGAEFGILGAGLGGIAAYFIQEEMTGYLDKNPVIPSKLDPRVIGSIPTDISNFTGRKVSLKTLSSFLRSNGSGVCTLIGLGGCGKSALLKKFGERESLFSKPNRKSSHDAFFSWSFFQDDNLDNFFSELYKYIVPFAKDFDSVPELRETSNPLVLPDIIKSSNKRIVLFLDGMERVIDERYTENIKEGSISTPALKALLQRAVENDCGSLRVFITTRIPVPEISNSHYKSSITLDLNRMNYEDAIALLKRSGARGDYKQLKQATVEYKFHAYSLSLLGKALVEEFKGDIRRRDRLITSGNEDEFPIGRILVWYLNYLNEISISILKAISLYRGSVSLSEIIPFLHVIAKKQSLSKLEKLSNRIIKDILRLSKLGLIFRPDNSFKIEESKVDLHPIVRDYFYNLLLAPKDLHEKALEILSASVAERSPSDSESIAVLVEMIYHAIKSRHFDLAWTIYLDRLGGYENIGYNRADHPLGTQLIYTFLDDSNFNKAEVSELVRTNLYMDGALYLKNEGRLDDAIELLNVIHPNIKSNPMQPDQYASLLLVKAGIELIRGKINDSRTSISKASKEFIKIKEQLNDRDSNRVQKECMSRLATIFAVIGDTETANLFEKAEKIPQHPETVPHDHLPIRYGWFLTLNGNYEKSREVLIKGMEVLTKLDAKMLKYRVKAMMVLNEAADGKIKKAEEILKEITSWTLRPDLHVFVLTFILRARLAIEKKEFSQAREIARRGLKYAGDNGYVLEWIDLILIMAESAIFTNNLEDAKRFSILALNGDTKSYSYDIKGASSTSLNYVWASLPARYIKVQSEILKLDSSESDKLKLDSIKIKTRLKKLGHPFLKKIPLLEKS